MNQRQTRGQGSGRRNNASGGAGRPAVDPVPSGQTTRTTEDTSSRYNLAGAPEGLGSLISGVIKDLQDLLRGEIQLAKTELKEDAAGIGKAAGLLAGAGVFGLVGLIFTLLAVMYLLDKVVQLWIAAGIVGLSVLAIAAILALVGKNKLSAANLKPEQTIETLKEDKEWASQQISSVKR